MRRNGSARLAQHLPPMCPDAGVVRRTRGFANDAVMFQRLAMVYFSQLRLGMTSGSSAILRPMSLIAIALLATLATSQMTRADDDDDYLDCVLDKAQAIMQTQTRKDAAAALKKAYRVCQPLERPKEADIGREVPLQELGRPLFAPANS